MMMEVSLSNLANPTSTRYFSKYLDDLEPKNQPLVTFTELLKNCGKPSFYQITPLTDRMNYCSSPINNMGWWMTLEKLLIEVPKRAQYLRVINGIS
jgi:hypothetical protein